MHATAGGTQRFAAEADLAEVGYSKLGNTGLTASRLGFGTYRVDDRVEEHREALTTALLSGVNLIDTASNYTGGHAEILVGQVLASLAAAGKVAREATVVVTKAGFVQGEGLAELQRLESAGTPRQAVSKVAPDVWHVLDADFLAKELEGSLERLGLDSIDACLLHNPETFTGDRAERDERMRQAFAAFERACDEGRLSFYGVSSNALALSEGDPAALTVARLLELARDAGGDKHRLRMVELPVNLLELGGRPAASEAAQAGLAVLGNRPLNAFTSDRLVRLAPPPPPPKAPPLADAADEVEAIEAVFAQDFAPRIQVEGNGPRPEELFRWGRELSTAPARVAGLDHFRAIEAQVILPQVNSVLPRLGQAFGGDPAFDAWARRYAQALHELLLSVTAELIRRDAASTAAMTARLDPIVPEAWRRASLSRRALASALSVPGVSSVLVGMRRLPWVEDALGAVALPALDPASLQRVAEALAP